MPLLNLEHAMTKEWIIILSFMAAASIFGVLITIYDKIAAKAAKRHRIPEAVLVTVGICGGALPMYLVMQVIRHKTRKPKFAVGFPVIIVLQVLALAAVWFWVL